MCLEKGRDHSEMQVYDAHSTRHGNRHTQRHNILKFQNLEAKKRFSKLPERSTCILCKKLNNIRNKNTMKSNVIDILRENNFSTGILYWEKLLIKSEGNKKYFSGSAMSQYLPARHYLAGQHYRRNPRNRNAWDTSKR